MAKKNTENPVAKHAHKFNKSVVHTDKKKQDKKGYRKHKVEYDNLLKWIGTALFFIAAILLSANFEYSAYGFIVFALGHIVLAITFFRLNDRPMFIQNFVFLFIDAYGIYNYFIR